MFNIVCYPAVFLTQWLRVYCVVCLQGNRLGWMGDEVVRAQIRSWLVWAKLLYPPLQRSWKGGTLVSPCPSVRLWTEWCPLCIFNNTHRIYFIFAHLINQNGVRSVSSTIPIGSISYLHILLTNFRRCVTCNVYVKFKNKRNFGEFFKFVTLTLFSFDLGSNMTQWYG